MSVGAGGLIRSIREQGSLIDTPGHTVRQNNWHMTVAIILADTVGTGVLSLPGAIAQLGWVIGLGSLLVSVPIFWFGGYLLMHCHLVIPTSRTYGDVGGDLLGAFGRAIGYFVVYFNIDSGSYSLVIAHNMQNLFYDVHLCMSTALLISFGVMFPFLQIRTFHNLGSLAWVSFVAILVVVVIAIGFLLSDSASCTGSPREALDYYGLFGTLGNIIWAYAGVSYYLEMMSEMKKPEDFAPKSGVVAFAVSTLLYMFTSVLTYSKCGELTPESLVDVIPVGIWKRVASLLMIFHIIVTFCISNVVVVRGLMCATGCVSGLQNTMSGRIIWCIATSALTGAGMLLALTVPQFENLNGLIGNVCAAACMLLPGLFFLLVQRKFKTWECGFRRSVVMGMCWPMMLLGAVLFVLGIGASIHEIIEAAKTDKAKPFACAAIHP